MADNEYGIDSGLTEPLCPPEFEVPGNPDFTGPDGFAETPGTGLCERDGEITDTYGGEHYWQCGHPGTVTVPSGRRMCEDHAGELGYGPKQEEYGFDPNDREAAGRD